MQFEKLCSRSCAKHLPHSDRPDAPRHASERDIFDVETAIEKKRKARSKLIHRNSARGEHLRVGETIRERISGLLHRCRTSFSNVVSADRNRIPTRHFLCGELNHVGKKTQR